jgi:hypothetical protein
VQKRDQMVRDWAVAGGWILSYIRTTLLRDVTHGSTGNGSASATGFRPRRNLTLLSLTLKLTFLTLIITCFQIHLERWTDACMNSRFSFESCRWDSSYVQYRN